MTVRSNLQPCPIFAQNFWLAGLTMASQELKPFAGIRQFGRGDQQSMAEYSHASRQPIHKIIIVFIKAGLVHRTRFPARGAAKRELLAVM